MNTSNYGALHRSICCNDVINVGEVNIQPCSNKSLTAFHLLPISFNHHLLCGGSFTNHNVPNNFSQMTHRHSKEKLWCFEWKWKANKSWGQGCVERVLEQKTNLIIPFSSNANSYSSRDRMAMAGVLNAFVLRSHSPSLSQDHLLWFSNLPEHKRPAEHLYFSTDEGKVMHRVRSVN